MRRVRIRDVTARDGLQAERPVDVRDRVELVRRLFSAGLRDVEAASFVSPKAVPAMAGGAVVVAAVLPDAPDGVTVWALVPNVKGAELATGAAVDHLTITVSASAAYSEKNVHMTVEEARAQVESIRAAAPAAVLDEVISCAFGSPFEGEDVTPDDVAVFVDHARAVGVDQVTLADTTGVGTPRRVREVLDRVGTDVGLHLHDTRGTALLNAWSAIDLGVTRFDTALGGLGGSPFAPDAGGNLATEHFVQLLEAEGYDTGVSVPELVAALEFIRSVV
jgi:hydroxymethylglutaryl-CoA lyase